MFFVLHLRPSLARTLFLYFPLLCACHYLTTSAVGMMVDEEDEDEGEGRGWGGGVRAGAGGGFGSGFVPGLGAESGSGLGTGVGVGVGLGVGTGIEPIRPRGLRGEKWGEKGQSDLHNGGGRGGNKSGGGTDGSSHGIIGIEPPSSGKSAGGGNNNSNNTITTTTTTTTNNNNNNNNTTNNNNKTNNNTATNNNKTNNNNNNTTTATTNTSMLGSLWSQLVNMIEMDDDPSFDQHAKMPLVWLGATHQDPFTLQRIDMNVVEKPFMDGLIYQGVLFLRLLGVGGVPVAMVFTPIVYASIVNGSAFDLRAMLLGLRMEDSLAFNLVTGI